MKIGFDFRMGGSINAGIGRYVFELLKNLLEINSAYEYYIFFDPENSNQDDLETLRQYKSSQLIPAPYRHYSIAEQFFFPKLLHKYKLDLVHFPNFNVPVRYKGKYIVTIHDMVHHKISGHKKSRLLWFYGYKYVIEQAAKRASVIITVTESAKKDIVDLLKVPAKKIEVIYEAPFLAHPEEGRLEKLKKQMFLTRPYFLFVGTLERKKNIVGLAKAFDKFIDLYNLNMDLIFAGKSDSHYPEIKQQALSIKHADRLIFTGYINDKDLSALYLGAYAFITASLHEGFGLPGVEAMQFGLPVLASDTSVFNEVYDNAAIYFNPSDPQDIAEQMRLIAQDQSFYEQMREKSLMRSSIFDWKKTALETAKLYDKLMTN